MERVVTAFSKLQTVLADGGERRARAGGDRQIVEADDADLSGDADAEPFTLAQDADSDQIVAAEDRSDALIDQSAGIIFGGIGNVVAVRHGFFTERKRTRGHAFNIGLPTLLRDHGIAGAVDEADMRMSKAHQMRDGVVDPFIAVRADGADEGILADVVIKKDCRDAGGVKLLHPGILQGKSDHKAADIGVLEHVGVIAFLLLKFGRYRNDGNIVLLAVGDLAEAEDDIVTELVGCFIVHVFYKDTKFFVVPAAHLLGCITHFNRGVQYGLTKGFADVACTVESLGNSADRYAKPVGDVFDCCHRYLP